MCPSRSRNTKTTPKPTTNATARNRAIALDASWGLFPTPSSLRQQERRALGKVKSVEHIKDTRKDTGEEGEGEVAGAGSAVEMTRGGGGVGDIKDTQAAVGVQKMKGSKKKKGRFGKLGKLGGKMNTVGKEVKREVRDMGKGLLRCAWELAGY